jgi:hypothetical protein
MDAIPVVKYSGNVRKYTERKRKYDSYEYLNDISYLQIDRK